MQNQLKPRMSRNSVEQNSTDQPTASESTPVVSRQRHETQASVSAGERSMPASRQIGSEV